MDFKTRIHTRIDHSSTFVLWRHLATNCKYIFELAAKYQECVVNFGMCVRFESYKLWFWLRDLHCDWALATFTVTTSIDPNLTLSHCACSNPRQSEWSSHRSALHQFRQNGSKRPYLQSNFPACKAAAVLVHNKKSNWGEESAEGALARKWKQLAEKKLKQKNETYLPDCVYVFS